MNLHQGILRSLTIHWVINGLFDLMNVSGNPWKTRESKFNENPRIPLNSSSEEMINESDWMFGMGVTGYLVCFHWNMTFIFPYIGNNHPNWRTLIFFRGVGLNNEPDEVFKRLLSHYEARIHHQSSWSRPITARWQATDGARHAGRHSDTGHFWSEVD